MEIWGTVALFVLGIVLTVKGGDLFVDAASWIAEVSGIPKFIIGATIVSLATTMPELLVSLLAAAQGKADMAIGNAVGSVTANTGLIMALALVCMPVTFARKTGWRKAALLLGAMAALWVASLSGQFGWEGIVLLMMIFALALWENLRGMRRESEATEKVQATRREKVENVLKFLLGAAAIVGGSQLLVNAGSGLALWLGVPERVIAVTLVAVGTSLPELVTTLTAIAKKQDSLSVGNVIGANIIDLTLILPLCALISGGTLPVSAQSLAVDFPACMVTLLVGLVPLLLRQKGARVQGIAMLALYAGYLTLVI